MIGPLVAMAVCNFSGARLAAPPIGRELGQLMIAITLGLYFTPNVAREVVSHAGLLLSAAFLSIGVGYIASRMLVRYARVDEPTAFFASVPGGAAEMATLGERFGAAVDKVAVAHSLRITLVVCTIPVLLTVLNVHGGEIYRPVQIVFSAWGLVALICIGISGGLLFGTTKFPNPWLMGPLLATMVLTASGVELSSMNLTLTNMGQVLLGCALGARFSKSFLQDAPRFVLVVVASIFLMMLLSTLIGVALGMLTGTFVPSMVLAMAPGGIAEMSITARTLQLAVALVTAAHVTRVLVIVGLTQQIFRFMVRKK
jgi:membrane AbrB-like protein